VSAPDVLVFVYGTLMRGQPNHHVLARAGARARGAATTVLPRTLVDLGPYPALLPRDGVRDASARAVTGELFAVSARALAALDEFEGCPDLYVRERIAVVASASASVDGAAHEAWTYVLAETPPPSARVLADGRYVGRESERAEA